MSPFINADLQVHGGTIKIYIFYLVDGSGLRMGVHDCAGFSIATVVLALSTIFLFL